MLTLLLKCLLYSSPIIHFSEEELHQYGQISSLLRDGGLQPAIELTDRLSSPAYRFLHYLSQTEHYLFHGSNNLELESLEPREQTLYNGTLTNAVFASGEAMWSIFYAVLHREKVVGGFRNGCIVTPSKKLHYYSLTQATMNNKPWTDGMLYILPKEPFHRAGKGKIMFDEWVTHESIKPLAKIRVSPNDFYFKNKVALHGEKEAILQTWLLYKIRVMKQRAKQVSKRDSIVDD